MTKHDRFYQLMSEKHADIFAEFDKIHTIFAEDGSNATDFHTVGQQVVDIIRSWERRLCSGMERGQHAQYSQRLAEKFWSKVTERYPLIAQVGVRTRFES